MGGAELGRISVFPPEQEEKITKQVMLLHKIFHVLKPVQMIYIVFDFVEITQIKHNFNKQNFSSRQGLAV
jgi:hypothetical protein